MKYLAIKLIRLYQKIPFRSHTMCKYVPTCSEYAIDALEEYGFLKGCYLAFKRICRCNPMAKGGYDPVPKNRHKSKPNRL